MRDPRRVRIVTEKVEGMEHTVFIERVTDGTVLGKYRTHETVNGKKVPGVQAAAAACKVNNWPVVQ